MPSHDPSGAPPQTGPIVAKRHNGQDYLFYALLTVILLAPLPLASNRPLPAALIALVLGGLTLIWASLIIWQNTPLAFPLGPVRWPLLLAGLTCFWILIQWSTWTPAALHHPVWQQTNDILGTSLTGRITANPHATMTGLMHLLSYIAVFWLALQLSARRSRAHLGIVAVTIGGTIYAAYGLAVYLGGNETILIFPKWAYPYSLTSTFVNKNSYATYAGLGLIVAVCLMAQHLQPILRMPGTTRRKAAELLDRAFGRDVLLALAIILLVSALALTLSRAGVLSAALGLALGAFIMLAGKRGQRRVPIAVASALVLTVVILLMISGDAITERYLQEDAVLTENPRWAVYRLILIAITDAPLLGTGFGTFADVFTSYRDTYVSNVGIWDKAHNTYLENALELGIPAALSLNAAIAILAWQTFKGVQRRKHGKLYPAIALATTLTVAVHSLVDFSLQIPAVSLTYAFLLGVGVAQSWRPGNPNNNENRLPRA